MRKLMVLAAMLAMMLVATSPAMAQTDDGGDENSVDLSSGDGSSFEDDLVFLIFFNGLFDDSDDGDFEFDSDDSDFEFDDGEFDIEFDDSDFDNNGGNNNRDDNNRGNGNGNGNGGRN